MNQNSREIKAWIEQSESDLDSAKIMLDAGKFKDCAYYCQQCIEKALKTLQLKVSGKVKKIHDISKLGKELDLPNPLIGYCNEINPAYIFTRYPDSTILSKETYNKKDCGAFLRNSKEIIEWVKRNL